MRGGVRRVVQEGAKPGQYQFRLLFGDPMPDAGHQFDVEVVDSRVEISQQGRCQHRVGSAVQPADWDLDAFVGEFSAKPGQEFPTEEGAVPV